MAATTRMPLVLARRAHGADQIVISAGGARRMRAVGGILVVAAGGRMKRERRRRLLLNQIRRNGAQLGAPTLPAEVLGR